MKKLFSKTTKWPFMMSRGLTHLEMLCYVFLTCNEATHKMGLYEIYPYQIATGIGVDIDVTWQIINGLKAKGMIYYDDSLLFVPGIPDEQGYGDDKSTHQMIDKLLRDYKNHEANRRGMCEAYNQFQYFFKIIDEPPSRANGGQTHDKGSSLQAPRELPSANAEPPPDLPLSSLFSPPVENNTSINGVQPESKETSEPPIIEERKEEREKKEKKSNNILSFERGVGKTFETEHFRNGTESHGQEDDNDNRTFEEIIAEETRNKMPVAHAIQSGSNANTAGYDYGS